MKAVRYGARGPLAVGLKGTADRRWNHDPASGHPGRRHRGHADGEPAAAWNRPGCHPPGPARAPQASHRRQSRAAPGQIIFT